MVQEKTTEHRFEHLSYMVMKALEKADPELNTSDAFAVLLKCICDGILLSNAMDENK